MRKRYFISVILVVVGVIIGVIACTKDISTTDYVGIIVEKSTMEPIEGVKVLITDYHNVYASDETDAQGAFEIKGVVTDELSSRYVLLIDGSPLGLPTKEEPLKGFGYELYDYKTIPLYDKTQDSLNPVVSMTMVSDVTSVAALFRATITKKPKGLDVADKGFVWGNEINPLLDTVGGNYVRFGVGAGDITHNVTSLTPDRVYYVRAYVTTSTGLTQYGEEATFTTIDGLATVEIGEIGNVTCYSATCEGNVTDDGGYEITERGFCWSTDQYPQISDSKVMVGGRTGSFNGSLSGLTPSTTYYVRAYAVNANGPSYSANQQTFTTTDGKAHVTTGVPSNVTSTSAVCTGNVTSDGGVHVTERGLCWGTSQYPRLGALNVNSISAGDGEGEFTGSMTGLSRNTTYYVCAYAINANGTEYGLPQPFTTTEGVPSVTTGTPSNITSTSAVCSGNVTSDGGVYVTERGLCWSTSQYPRLGLPNVSSIPLGDGEGPFTGSMTGLSRSTTYYVCAYATNANDTKYGSQQSFTTTSGKPELTTYTVADVTTTSALCGGSITSDGGYDITDKGLVWGTSINPTVGANNSVSRGSGNDSFTATVSGLAIGTTYYIRAYATNVNGTEYGENRSFTTSDGKPTVTTTPPVRNDLTVVTGGTVSDDGGYEVTSRGICYGLTANPDLGPSYSQIIDGNGGRGSFTSTFTLPGPGVYYIRAYATNSMGTKYGQQVTVSHPYNELPTFTYGGQTYRVAPAATNNMTWSDANDYCNDLDLYGYTDWRLPSKDELMAMSSLLNKNSGWWSGTQYSSTQYYYLRYRSSSSYTGWQSSYEYSSYLKSARPVRVEN